MKRSPSWRTVMRMERARWHRFARAHADTFAECAEVAGRPVDQLDQDDAVTLARIARDHGLTLERAGSPAAPMRSPR